VDTKPLMERALAVCAGVGVLGKHGCLIVPGLGSWVVLACLLTTAAPPGSATPRASLPSGRDFTVCGSCTRCLDACPTAAFEGPGRLDARRCISYLTIEHRGPIAPELAQRLGVRIAGCDVCQDVCPWNASDSREARAPPQAWLTPPPRGFREVDLTKIAAFGSSPHRSFVRSTPLMRISRRQLRRNALAALGNLPGAPTAGEEAALAAAESDDDELLRTTARDARARRLHRG
jgi:epoxyqueuosine reductase